MVHSEQTSKTVRWMKEPRHDRIYMTLLFLCEISTKDIPVEIGNRLMVAWGGRGRECGGKSFIVSRHKGIYWGNGDVKLIYCDGCTTCKFTLKIIELYTCNRWTLWCIKCDSLKFYIKVYLFYIKDAALQVSPVPICDFSSLLGLNFSQKISPKSMKNSFWYHKVQ